jgi:tol-pal system protein YbgF
MGYMSKALVAGGLVVLTGPLCLMAGAQDYVDVEGEQAAGAARASAVDPYGADPAGSDPAQAYPATSYGLNKAPAGAPVTTAPTGVAATGGQGQNLGNLFLQIQQLQQDVMRLNGIVEEQAHELRKLKEQSLERYVDLDKRLSAAAGATTVVASGQGGNSGSNTVAPSNGNGSGPTAEQPGEGEAYRAAYALVRGQKFDQAVQAFQQFLGDYPDGRYAPNAHYWLGELYLVAQPQDLEASRQSFMLLVTQYPDNPKVPDALYKLGRVHFLKGNREKAREYLDGVIKGYGDTSAAKLAKDFIAANY